MDYHSDSIQCNWSVLVDSAFEARLEQLDCLIPDNLQTLRSEQQWSECAADFLLRLHEGKLAIVPRDKNMGAPLSVEFESGQLGFRGRQNVRNEMVVKAVLGKNKQQLPKVLDLTAGLGRDGFVLATAGCCVTLVERHWPVFILLKDGLYRANGRVQAVERMELFQADSANFLGEVHQYDVVYLDPMFPSRAKSAKVKKEMNLFHQLVGSDADSDTLFRSVCESGAKKLVVKRPRKADTLAGATPTYSLTGRSSRFDVYQLRS